MVKDRHLRYRCVTLNFKGTPQSNTHFHTHTHRDKLCDTPFVCVSGVEDILVKEGANRQRKWIIQESLKCGTKVTPGRQGEDQHSTARFTAMPASSFIVVDVVVVVVVPRPCRQRSAWRRGWGKRRRGDAGRTPTSTPTRETSTWSTSSSRKWPIRSTTTSTRSVAKWEEVSVPGLRVSVFSMGMPPGWWMSRVHD